MKKVFGIPFSGSEPGPSDGALAKAQTKAAIARAQSKVSLQVIQQFMTNAVAEFPGIDTERVLYKIKGSNTAQDLWILRSDLYQVISKAHSQTEAARRINALLPCFSHWIPEQQLTKI
jgi:hypothetical protein